MSLTSSTDNLFYIGTLQIKDCKANLYFVKDDQRCFRSILALEGKVNKEDQFTLRQMTDIVSNAYKNADLVPGQSSVTPSPFPRESAVWLWGLGEVDKEYPTFYNAPFVGFTTNDRKYRFSDPPVSWPLYTIGFVASSFWEGIKQECDGLPFVTLNQ